MRRTDLGQDRSGLAHRFAIAGRKARRCSINTQRREQIARPAERITLREQLLDRRATRSAEKAECLLRPSCIGEDERKTRPPGGIAWKALHADSRELLRFRVSFRIAIGTLSGGQSVLGCLARIDTREQVRGFGRSTSLLQKSNQVGDDKSVVCAGRQQSVQRSDPAGEITRSSPQHRGLSAFGDRLASDGE